MVSFILPSAPTQAILSDSNVSGGSEAWQIISFFHFVIPLYDFSTNLHCCSICFYLDYFFSFTLNLRRCIRSKRRQSSFAEYIPQQINLPLTSVTHQIKSRLFQHSSLLIGRRTFASWPAHSFGSCMGRQRYIPQAPLGFHAFQ